MMDFRGKLKLMSHDHCVLLELYGAGHSVEVLS